MSQTQNTHALVPARTCFFCSCVMHEACSCCCCCCCCPPCCCCCCFTTTPLGTVTAPLPLPILRPPCGLGRSSGWPLPAAVEMEERSVRSRFMHDEAQTVSLAPFSTTCMHTSCFMQQSMPHWAINSNPKHTHTHLECCGSSFQTAGTHADAKVWKRCHSEQQRVHC